MATTSKKYTISRKISDTEEEEVKVPSSAISGLATVATSGSYNDLADKPSIPDISGKANLNGGNGWTGNQQFNQGGYWFATAANHPFVVELENGDALVKVNPNGVSFDSDGLGTMPFLLNGNAGTSGQVLMSSGSGITPKWGDVSYDNLADKPTNLVTTDTEQSISGAKKFTSDVVISKSAPNLNMKMSGLTNGTNPTSNIYSGLNFEEKDGKNLSEFRNQVTSTGRTSTDLWTRSFGTNYGNYVGFFASPNATSAKAEGVWHFSPNLNAKHDLGQSNLCWANGYITNLQNVKLINGNGGNSLIQQTGASGSDITVGSVSCALKLIGKNARPTYTPQNGSDTGLALQSDIPTIPPIPYDGNGLSTGTLGGATYFLTQPTRLYFEKLVGSSFIAGVLYAETSDYGFIVPVKVGSAINFAQVSWKAEQKTITIGGIGKLETVYYPQVTLYNTSGSTVTNSTYTSGSFNYKSLRYN